MKTDDAKSRSFYLNVSMQAFYQLMSPISYPHQIHAEALVAYEDDDFKWPQVMDSSDGYNCLYIYRLPLAW